jgi:hypothetical protein
MPENENTGELHESPLDPAQDERIRRLLADARHTEPMPEAVVARLDRVLSGLSEDRTERAERAEGAERAEVVDLMARRRRTVGQLLVAAAAVVAVGFGMSQVLPDLGGSSAGDAQETTAGGAAADSADGAEEGDDEGSRFVSPESAPEAPSDGASDGATDGATGGAAKSTLRIRSDEFGPDVRRARNQLEGGSAALVEYPAEGCLAVSVEPGSEVVATTYDAAPAALVLRPPSGDVQVVDLYLCGDLEPRRSITLTAP